MNEDLEALRELLDLHDRSATSFVQLIGERETTTDDVRTFERSGEVAWIFLGTDASLAAELVRNDDGSATITIRVNP